MGVSSEAPIFSFPRTSIATDPTPGRACARCGSARPLSEFTSGRPECNPCRSARRKANYDPRAQRATNLKASFGITITEYETLLRKQGGGCAICGGQEPIRGRSLAVDHCHASGAVRGVLCSPCNLAIGKLRDDVELLRSAIRYLENPPYADA